jgi:hypothetical protein
MGFIDNKNNLVNQVGVFKTLGDLPKSKRTSQFNSVNSKSKNLFPFMMDLLSIACIDNARKQRAASQPETSPTGEGPKKRSNFLKSVPDFRDVARCEAKKILIEVLVEFFPALVRIIKEGIVMGIKESMSCSSDFTIASPPPSVTVDIKTIDFGDMMKVDPQSFGGSLIYGANANTDFNRFLYNTIQTPSVLATWNGPNGPMLDVTFNNPSSVTLTINNNYVGSSFNGFVNDYVNSIELFSQKNLTSNLLDNFFGNISSATNLGLDINIENEKTNQIVNKLLDEDPCVDEIVYDNSYFEFDNEQLAQIEIDANNKTIGVKVVDLGCGLVETTIDDVIISGLTTLDFAEPTKVEDIITTTIDNVNDEISSFGDEKDSPSIKNDFNLGMLMSIPNVSTKMMMTPKVLTLYQICDNMVNNTTSDATTGTGFARKSSSFFEYVTREAFAALMQIIFNKLKGEILRLIQNVIIIIIKEQIKIYIKQLTTLFTSQTGSITDGFS